MPSLPTSPADKRPRVYLARGPDGLETGVVGSINTEIIERAGGRNVVEAAGQRGLVRASMEQVIVADPEIIITWDRNFFDRVGKDPLWAGMQGRAREARLSGAHRALRLDRPAAVAQPRDRPEMAGRAVLPGHSSGKTFAKPRGRSIVCSITWTRATPSWTLSSHGRRDRHRIRDKSRKRSTAALRPRIVVASRLLVLADAGGGPGRRLSRVARRVCSRRLGASVGARRRRARSTPCCSRCGCRACSPPCWSARRSPAAGAAYQTLFRNPLVSPDILGVSTGAGLGAVLGIFLSLPVAGIQLAAFVDGARHRRPRLRHRLGGARARADPGAGAGGRGGGLARRRRHLAA